MVERMRKPDVRLHRDSDLTGRLGLIYGRKSNVDLKNPGKSTGDQTDFMQAQFERRGLVTRAVLVDEGIGASKHSATKVRVAYEEIMSLVATEPIAVVAFWELSRSSRRLKIHGELMETLEDHNVLLMIADRIYDPADADDQLQLGIGAVMNAAEAARTRARTLRGTHSAAQMGLPHGQTPYGYDPRTRALVRVEEVPEEAAVIRELAERVLAGDSSRSIARDLNERALPRPYGGAWTAPEVRDILTRPTYIGRRTHNGLDVAQGVWPPILELETFEDLGRIFKVRQAQRGSWSTKAKYLLTGSVFCGVEGSRMHGEQSRMALPTDKRPPMGYRCAVCRKTRNIYELDDYVTSVVNSLLSDPDALRVFLGATESTEVAELGGKLEVLRKELEEAEIDLGNDEISAKAFTIIERRIDAERARLGGDVQTRTERHGTYDKIIASGVTSLDQLPFDKQRAMIHSICRVVVRPTERRGKGFDRTTVDVLRPA
jgi:site-specific DNA recombinase